MLEDDSASWVHVRAVRAIGRLGGEHAPEVLRPALADRDMDVRSAAVEVILNGREREKKLMSRDFYGFSLRDPKVRISSKRVREAAKTFGESEEQIRREYEGFADELGLSLQWRRSS